MNKISGEPFTFTLQAKKYDSIDCSNIDTINGKLIEIRPFWIRSKLLTFPFLWE
jgi:hypothetical protein